MLMTGLKTERLARLRMSSPATSKYRPGLIGEGTGGPSTISRVSFDTEGGELFSTLSFGEGLADSVEENLEIARCIENGVILKEALVVDQEASVENI